MTTIDVNTGGFVGVRSFDDTIFKTNLEAAQVIARQLRMRNLGGIIIIDFIDMMPLFRPGLGAKTKILLAEGSYATRPECSIFPPNVQAAPPVSISKSNAATAPRGATDPLSEQLENIPESAPVLEIEIEVLMIASAVASVPEYVPAIAAKIGRAHV